VRLLNPPLVHWVPGRVRRGSRLWLVRVTVVSAKGIGCAMDGEVVTGAKALGIEGHMAGEI